MAQISKGDTFTDGQQVTGARLNQLVDSSVLLVGAITDQSPITASTLALDDLIIVSDTSATALKKASINDIIGSSLPITASTLTATSVVTSTLNAAANSDIIVTPNDGTVVSGKTFTSGDGVVATVLSLAHGLTTNQSVTITASNSAYSGTYRITVITADSFTYNLYPTTTAASGTCSYVKEGSVRINGELNVSNNINVVGQLNVLGTILNTGSVVNTGSVINTGSVLMSGAVTATNITANLTSASTAITQVSTDSSTKIATTAFVNTFNTVNFIKAWVCFNGQGTVAIRSSFNVSSVTDNGTGDYMINFTNAMPDANYGVVATCMRTSGNTGAEAFVLETTTPSTTLVRIGTTNQGGTFQDSAYVTVVIYR